MDAPVMRRIGALAAVAALGIGGGMLGGCGESGTPASGSTATSGDLTVTDGASRPGNGIETLPAREILDRSLAAAREASSVRVVGDITNDSQKIALDLVVSKDAADGTMAIQGNEVMLRLVDGRVYLRASQAFLEKAAGPRAAAIVPLLADKWFSVPAGGDDGEPFGGFTQLTDKDALIEGILGVEGDLETKGSADVGGTPVILIGKAGDDSAALAVATVGDPYPLQFRGENASDSGRIDFTGWNAPVTITAPEDALDFGALAGSTGSGTTTS